MTKPLYIHLTIGLVLLRTTHLHLRMQLAELAPKLIVNDK